MVKSSRNDKKKFERIEKNIEEFTLFASLTDKTTQDIFEITNPFEMMLPQFIERNLSNEINTIFDLKGHSLLSFVALGEKIRPTIMDNRINVLYRPDFDSLSNETKEKIETGVYKLGESKKVEGNMRSVLVDTQNSNRRVEDVTLKKIDLAKQTQSQFSDIAIQLQLKQIYDILLDIQQTQNYQLHWDRNNSILSPFFSARATIIEFHNNDELEEKIKLLKTASKFMENSVSHIKSDLISNQDFIKQLLDKPTYKYATLESHANFILADINLLLKIVGMQIYIDLVLGNENMAKERFLSLNYVLNSFSKKNIPQNKSYFSNVLKKVPVIRQLAYISEELESISLMELINDHYKYNSNNLNSWLIINDEIKSINQENLLNKGE